MVGLCRLQGGHYLQGPWRDAPLILQLAKQRVGLLDLGSRLQPRDNDSGQFWADAGVEVGIRQLLIHLRENLGGAGPDPPDCLPQTFPGRRFVIFGDELHQVQYHHVGVGLAGGLDSFVVGSRHQQPRPPYLLGDRIKYHIAGWNHI